MGLWNWIERRLWTGDVVKDYGPISDSRYGGLRRKISVMLAKGGTRVILRVSYRRLVTASIQFVELDRDAASKLRDALDDALLTMSPDARP